jgi:hypothetical protein
VVGTAVAIAGAVVGFILGSPQAGFTIGQEFTEPGSTCMLSLPWVEAMYSRTCGFDAALDGLGKGFDSLGPIAGPPNCNGEVPSDTFIYQTGQWMKALNQPGRRKSPARQRPGLRITRAVALHLAVQRFPAAGLCA